MAACEACWTEAWKISRVKGTNHVDEYQRLIRENPGGCNVESELGEQ